MALASLWGDFGVMLWSLYAFGGAVGSHWCIFETLWNRFGFTLGAFGGHCAHMNVASGYFAVALGLL